MSSITAFINNEELGRLKAELQILRRKGALKPSADYDNTGPDPERSCGRCRTELGRVINRGAYCRACRLKVCKNCREYSFRTTDWVCTVCHKHMEIQAASGEWMNEFVRRPSRRRDNRVYVPAADIIKRTIRRSWTISNPTPRWNAVRCSPETRLYNSLPRGQDISNYPSLAVHQTNARNVSRSPSPSRLPTKHSPAKRSHSEDVYNERSKNETVKTPVTPKTESPKRAAGPKTEPTEKQQRVNPLIKYASERKKDNYESDNSNSDNDGDVVASSSKNKRRLLHTRSETTETTSKFSKKPLELSKSVDTATSRNRSYEKRVSFNNETDEKPKNKAETDSTAAEVHYAKEEGPIELCDIEPLSGTVFRKVTVRRRRQDMRKMQAVDAGWRRGTDTDLLDILLPEGDDYKLVFISSDSSSKEEDVDDNDSSSTASSFPIDECDWDYFEPGSGTGTRPVINWNSPFGSPSVYRRSTLESPLGSPLVYRRGTRESDTGTDEDNTRLDSGSPASSDSLNFLARNVEESNDMEGATLQCMHQAETPSQRPPCQSCGAPTQYVPIPVPVPIPIPMPVHWNPQDSVVLYSPETLEALKAHLRILPRTLWPYLNQAAIIWPLISSGEPNPFISALQNSDVSESTAKTGNSVSVAAEQNSASTVEQRLDNDQTDVNSSATSADKSMKILDEPKIDFSDGYLESECKFMSSSSSEESSENEDGKEPKYRRTYNVSGGNCRESDDALPSSDVTDYDDGRMSQISINNEITSSGSEDTDSDDTGTVADKKCKKLSRVYVVNANGNSSESDTDTDSDTDSSEVDDEEGGEIVLTCVKQLSEACTSEPVINVSICDRFGDSARRESEYISSPGLSDVSAESLNSSDVEGAAIDAKRDLSDKELSEESVSVSADGGEWNANTGIRSGEPVNVEGNQVDTRCDGEQRPGVPPVNNETDSSVLRHAATRYTSLVMITQDSAPSYAPVSVVTSDTTTLVPDNDVVVRHTNWQEETGANKSPAEQQQGLTGYFTLTLENGPACSATPNPPVVSKCKAQNTDSEDNKDVTVVATSDTLLHASNQSNVTVITGADTLSAVVCLEEGLADDDSWVENLSHDEDDFCGSTNDETSSGEEVTLHCTAAIDHEDELRGYHRAAIDFTLHTIVEESCEESEVEQTSNKKLRPTSATDLEKYFYFGLGDGNMHSSAVRDDAFSETSSICSESMDSFGGADDAPCNENSDPADLASSRLEKYFLSGFTSFKERRDSDGSVGSDSEGRPSPEQRRKRLVRARGTGRSHSSSLDNLISNPDLSSNEQSAENQLNSEDSSSSDTDTYDELNSFDKNDGQFDTVKRKKNKKQKNGANSPAEDNKALETTQELNEECASDEDGHKTPQPDLQTFTSDFSNRNKQQSRDSGFIGSNDDLNKDTKDTSNESATNTKTETKTNLYNISEEKRDEKVTTLSTPPATSLTRKDSFNNWSSDEETNLMMCKMRQFFKTMVANNNHSNPSSKPTTPIMGPRESPKPVPSPRLKNRCKPPQLVYFENELTRLMKTVPGIRDDQVREIVEYLSSEDTWSDSYDSSDYTSSDLEGTAVCGKSVLQQQISDSCKQIINKFDTAVEDEEGDEGDGGIIDESHGLNRETAFVYQKLVASFEKMATGDSNADESCMPPHNSPPLIAKVMHHIGSRLVALMHEVSSGESHTSNSPKTRHFHRRLQQKLSNASTTTTEDDDSTSDTNLADKLSALEDTAVYNILPRSRSHDLLVSENRTLHQSSSGVSDIAEEREASDCERFSWRGSFESALLATDSRNKLSLIGGEGSASASALALAAKRRSAGDLLFTHKSLSREQLDRVRSCGSIGGSNSEDKLWVASATRPSRRRSSVPDASCGSGGSADGEDDDEEDLESRSTLPRSLQSGAATTNSLPRLPTNTATSTMHKAQSMYHFLQQNVKSARYRPPGFNRLITSVPKRAVSAPGLQPTPQRRGRRQQAVIANDEISISEAHSSPMLSPRATKSATPSPVAHKARRGILGSQEWQSNEEEADKFPTIHTRSSLSNLGSRSDSMASVYSGAGDGRYGTVAVKGQVEFGLQYNYKDSALEIVVKQCKDLAAVDSKRNKSDPYVKVYLLPDKSKSGKRKTKVKKHTLNPVFDECLKFHISLNGLETRTLWLTVWHSDMFGRNDFLGEVMMTLENKVFDDPNPKWYNLQERTEPFEDMLSFKGDILVALKFVPPDMTVVKKGKRSRGALHVLVKEAKSLTAIKSSGTSDPFCKSYLLPDKGRNAKQKTRVSKRTVNPIWNHTFIYDDVSLQELAERCLELTVWDSDRFASNEFLGGVRFSLGTGKHYGKSVDWMDATGKEMSLWKSMLDRPNFWVESSLSLRPTLDHRTSP